MIASQDRSGYIGASDVDKVVGNWATKSWEGWWLQKLGIARSNYQNDAMIAGTNWEHRILEAYFDAVRSPLYTLDAQYVNEDLRLRVNLDGNTEDEIVECKTTGQPIGKFRAPIKYIRQVQVQMFGSGFRKGKIIVYHLDDKEYSNYFKPVEMDRLEVISVDYDEDWIKTDYLQRHMILRDCLINGTFPD